MKEKLKWFREVKFGLFIHWGLYAELAGYYKDEPIYGIGEQIMRFAKIPVAEYEKLTEVFNPVKFNAREWVALAKEAGMKYLVFTAKHHDGFAMYDSKCSDYNIMNTPFGRDIVKELAEACNEAGIRLCLYYSQFQDWHHPHGGVNPPQWDGLPEAEKDYDKYFDEKALPQVREMLTNYGPISLIWYDTPSIMTAEQSKRFADLTRELQPDCVISPRVGNGMGDYKGFRDNQVPTGNEDEPWETCATMNHTWGFKKQDNNWKNPDSLVKLLSSIVGKGGNYLLNVGPDSQGLIPEPSVKILKEIGKWLRSNGEAIYGTRGCILPYELDWGTLTYNDGKLYAHIHKWSGKFTLTGLKNKVTKMYLLNAPDTELAFTQEFDSVSDYSVVMVDLSGCAPDTYVTVLAMEIGGELDMNTEILQQADGSIELFACVAEKSNPPVELSANGITENWFDTKAFLSWTFHVTKPGRFKVILNTFTEKRISEKGLPGDWEGGHQFTLSVNDENLQFTAVDNGRFLARDSFDWENVVTNAGEIEISSPGIYKAVLKADAIISEKKLGPKTRSVELKPVE